MLSQGIVRGVVFFPIWPLGEAVFCIVKGLETLGFGKIVDATGSNWTVEYFDAPGPLGRELHRVPKSHVIKKTLGANTRVYYFIAAENKWLVGRVLDDFSTAVLVRFSNKTDIRLNHDDLLVRWKKPIGDPVVFLANRVTETPFYAEARSDFLSSYIAQRGASWGISGLLSSVIELEPHQINVVRRVLSDASQRYLLADEVGLGKTIEAGIIIRQAVLDDPTGHRVVILVPHSLVQQWRQELIQKFCLDGFLDESVFVFPHEWSRELETNLSAASMLVVDEAHHLTAASNERVNELYEIVRKAALKIERLLLLSATPVLRNEAGFLRMLHLLDPVIYPLGDEANFRIKVEHRQALAEAVASLDPDNVLQLDWILADLLSKLPRDERLAELVRDLQKRLMALPSPDDPELIDAVGLLRAHLSETYRLHRRILRNRRKRIKYLTPDRSGALLYVAPDIGVTRLESALETWRIHALVSSSRNPDPSRTNDLESFFWQAVAALIECPVRLRTICDVRQRSARKATSDFSEVSHEDVLLNNIAAAVDIEGWLKGRLRCVEDVFSEVLVSSVKVVIFCAEKQTADWVFANLNDRYRLASVRHEVAAHEDEELPWHKFLSDRAVTIIVCDSSAEEGLNLQGGEKIVIHFDLPLSPNRIEQRIGRVDRYGSGTAVPSVVIIDDGSKFQRLWYDALDQGLGIFGRSVASLQYLIDDELNNLKSTLFTDGVEALEELILHLSGPEGVVAKEIKLIDQQDGLDELAPLAEPDNGRIDETDGAWKEIRQSLMYWVIDTLMFAKIPLSNAPIQAGVDPSFRFQYQKPGQGGHATLIPLSGFLYDFVGVLDYDAPGSNSSQPRSYPYSFHRRAAVSRGVRLLRFGDAFVEAVKAFSDIDDRGRIFAIWRQIHKDFKGQDPSMYFCFDFLVEAQLDTAIKVLLESVGPKSTSARAAMARRGDANFSPRVERVWIDEDGREPPPAMLDNFLNPPYSKDGAGSVYLDTNLNATRLDDLVQYFPDTFFKWEERCNRMRGLAQSVLVNRKEFIESKRDAIAKAEKEDQVRYAQLHTRIQNLEGIEMEVEVSGLKTERRLNSAVYGGIENPSIKVDVVGVVFLSCHAFSQVETGVEAST